MTLRARWTIVILGVAVIAFSLVGYVGGFLRHRAPTIAGTKANGEATMVLQTVGSIGFGPNPDWVSYMAQDASGAWVHSTELELPAHSTVHVKLYQYDSQTGLRNPFLGQTQGLVDGTMSVDGKSVAFVDPATAAHTFAIPDLGVVVPLPGIADTASNPCPAAPCTTDYDHVTIEFTFKTGTPGRYRWQCFVPCAAGTLFGNGGPMQTVGFMDGFIEVV